MLLEHHIYSPNCILFQQPSEYLDRKMVRDARVETVPPSEEPMIKNDCNILPFDGYRIQGRTGQIEPSLRKRWDNNVGRVPRKGWMARRGQKATTTGVKWT